MAKRTPRYQVQELQQAGVAPASAPVNNMIQGVRAGPVDTSVLEGLAPLSRDLRGVLQGFSRQNNLQDREAVKEGQAFANDPATLTETEEQRKERFAKLQAEGKIRYAANPNFWSAFEETGGRSLVGAYERAVLARQDEALIVHDENGLLKATTPIEQIQAEEWAKLAEHASYANYYGRREADRLRGAVDAGIQTRVGEKFAQNAREYTRRGFEGEFLDLAYAAAVDGDPDGRMRAAIGKRANDARLGGMEQPAFAVSTGVIAAVKKIHAELGADRALHALDVLEGVKVNGLELGRDARIADDFATMRLNLENAEERESSRASEDKAATVRMAITDGTNLILGKLQAAEADGTPREHALDAALAEADQFGVNAPIVRSEMQKHYKAHVEEAFDPAAYDNLLAGVADGSVTPDILYTARDGGLINGKQFGALYQSAREKADLRKEISEDRSYAENLAMLHREIEASGLRSPEQRAALSGLADEFTMGVEDLWAMRAEDPRGFTKEVRGLRTTLQARVREIETKADTDRATFIDSINQSNTSKVDRSADILKSPLLTADEKAALLQQNRTASDLTRLFQDPGVAEARQNIRNIVRGNAEAAALPESAIEPLIAQHLAMFDDELIVQVVAESPGWNAASYNSKVRQTARLVSESTSALLEGAVGKAARTSASRGEALEESAKRVEIATNNENTADAFLATSSLPRSQFAITTLGHGRPKDILAFDAIERWYRQDESFLFGRPERPDRDSIIAQIEKGGEFQRSTQKSEQARIDGEKVDNDAILAVYKYLGLPLEAVKAGALVTPGGKSIPIDAKTINPFTTVLFSSPAELDAFKADLSKQREAAEIFRLNDQSMEKFVDAQTQLQRLLNP